MKVNKSLRILIIYLLCVVALGILASCGSLKKLRTNTKEISKVDSVSHVKTKVDSSGTTTVTKTDSSGLTVEAEFEHDDSDSGTDVEITVHGPAKDDYFKPTVVIKSNKKLKNLKLHQQEKKSAAETTTASVNKKEDNKVAVKTIEKKKETVVAKDKQWFSWWWLVLLLLIPVAVKAFKLFFPVPYKKLISVIKKIKQKKEE